LRVLHEALQLASQSRAIRHNIGRAYLESGNWAKALEEFAGNPLWTAITLARAGRVEEASRIELPQRVDIVGLAAYHTALGEHTAALELLEEAIHQRHQLLPQIAVDPSWRPLQKHLRFSQLTARVAGTAPR
jgi:hypothetical protein